MRLFVVNGPNLNLLGTREPQIYGSQSLDDIQRMVDDRAKELGVELEWRQSNHEGGVVDSIQESASADGLILNAAALTHGSLSVRDALLAVDVPFVEVHLSNIFAREPERRKSVMADIAIGVIAGFGAKSYVLGLESLVDYLRLREGSG
ncbi:MAG: type II 3-dehydroquinate dehydratase [Gemmatimonadetes bacterium]|nr:type II 3-dehydroquinate dehydratase [Gemmatimonadota bacterium]